MGLPADLDLDAYLSRCRAVEIFMPPPPPEILYELGACFRMDSGRDELFFPAKQEAAKLAQAKRVCAGCDVQLECFEYALANPKLQGVWGGAAEKERKDTKGARARLSVRPEAISA